MQRKNQVNKIPFFDSGCKKTDAVELDKEIFDGTVNKQLLYQSLVMYRANQRQGTASTKRRGEVRGGGKKPWRQKGTGRARVRSIRNPIWRGGGVAFGPHPRDYRYDIPRKMKKLAFVSSINAKLKSEAIMAIEDIKLSEPKSKLVAELLKKLKIEGKALLLVDKIDRNTFLAARNIKKLTLKKVAEATSLDVLSNDCVVMTKSALEFLNKMAKEA